MTTLVLHIGVHKTGTSSIQETLAHNREMLLRRGVLVPSVLPSNHSHFVYDAFADAPENYHANRARGRDRETIAARVAMTFDELRREVEAHEPDTLVFSAEDACTLRPAEVERLRDRLGGLFTPTGVRVVLYTRHPVSYVTSAVQENVKGNGLTLERAKAIHVGDTKDRYRTIVDTWSAVFGEGALTVNSMEAAVAGPRGLVGHMLAVLGTGTEGVVEVRRNESICDEVLDFLAERNAAGAPPLAAGDARLLFGLAGNRASVLSAAERDAVWSRALPDMNVLAERFGILYEPPQLETADVALRRARLEEFCDALSAILPRLDPDLATELADRFVLPVPMPVLSPLLSAGRGSRG